MFGQVGDLEPELFIDGSLHGGLSIADDVAQVAEAGDEGTDVVFGELADGGVAVLAGVAGERGAALGLDLAGPLGHGLRVGSGVRDSLVAGKPGVTVSDESLSVFAGPGGRGGVRARVLGLLHLADVCSSRCGAKMTTSQASMAGSRSASRR